jgi:predicted transcriptional regulator
VELFLAGGDNRAGAFFDIQAQQAPVVEVSRSFYFDPVGTGLTVFLGPTEVRLMELCWTHGPLTVKKAVFYWDSGSKPAYTTLMTILGRLVEKGLLTKGKSGRSFVYTPTIGRDAFIADRLATIVACLRTNFPAALKAR